MRALQTLAALPEGARDQKIIHQKLGNQCCKVDEGLTFAAYKMLCILILQDTAYLGVHFNCITAGKHERALIGQFHDDTLVQ